MVNKKILVVDDESKIVEIVSSYLKQKDYDVIKAYTGKEAIALFERDEPDLIILDLMLPDITGEEICSHIRKKSHIPIIMLTAKVEEKDLLNGYYLGIDDYIKKPFSPRELIVRVDAILKRASHSPVPLLKKIHFDNDDLVIDTEKQEVRKAGKIINFTVSEYRILITLVSHPGRIFTRDELVTFSLGNDFDGYDRIIDTFIKTIRKKIETDNKKNNYIGTVYGVGYKFIGE